MIFKLKIFIIIKFNLNDDFLRINLYFIKNFLENYFCHNFSERNYSYLYFLWERYYILFNKFIWNLNCLYYCLNFLLFLLLRYPTNYLMIFIKKHFFFEKSLNVQFDEVNSFESKIRKHYLALNVKNLLFLN
jgi:hypothetical protein